MTVLRPPDLIKAFHGFELSHVLEQGLESASQFHVAPCFPCSPYTDSIRSQIQYSYDSAFFLCSIFKTYHFYHFTFFTSRWLTLFQIHLYQKDGWTLPGSVQNHIKKPHFACNVCIVSLCLITSLFPFLLLALTFRTFWRSKLIRHTFGAHHVSNHLTFCKRNTMTPNLTLEMKIIAVQHAKFVGGTSISS